MTALTVEVNDLACGRCGMTTDLCLSMKDECCVGCTHYPEPIADDVDEVAVARAIAGDRSVPLNRAEYAEAHRVLHDEGKSISQIATLLGATERSVDRWNQGHTRPISRPGSRAMSTTEELLIKAASHPAKRVQAAARRAQDAIQRVHDLLAEDAGKAKARKRVERLECELREAKAALRGGQAKRSKPQATREWSGETLPCRKGCGKTSPNGQGRAAHERHCTHTAVA